MKREREKTPYMSCEITIQSFSSLLTSFYNPGEKSFRVAKKLNLAVFVMIESSSSVGAVRDVQFAAHHSLGGSSVV